MQNDTALGLSRDGAEAIIVAIQHSVCALYSAPMVARERLRSSSRKVSEMATEPTIGEIFQLDAEPVTALKTAQSVRVPEPGRRANKWLLLWMIPAAIPVVVIAASSSSTKTQSVTASACTSDWSKCTDNVEMARNYNGWTKAEVKCKMAASKLAKYGTPEWPWLAFQSLSGGKDFAETGIAALIEPDAQYQNSFGAMVHTRVVCEYDLGTEKVTDVGPVDLPYDIYRTFEAGK